jgi:hypothetical protein
VEPTNSFFPYDRSESFLYRSFKRWVPPPPNSPLMTDEEKQEATTCRVQNPHLCKCGYHSKLANLATGLDYTIFWCCPIPLSVIAHKRCLSLIVKKYWFYVHGIDFNVFYKVTSEGVISINLFTVLGPIDLRT